MWSIYDHAVMKLAFLVATVYKYNVSIKLCGYSHRLMTGP